MSKTLTKYPESFVHLLSRKETKAITQRWLSTFCDYSQNIRDKIHLNQYLWHTFSYKKHSSISGEKALEVYRAKPLSQYYVLANDGELIFIVTKPIERCLFKDFYVFPEDIAGTIAFTHEDDCGPYFAENKKYKKEK